MSALVRYALALLGRGQGYLAPVLLFATGLVVLTTNDRGPLAGTYAACALVLFASQAWLTAALVNAEDDTQHALTVVAAGSSRRVLVAQVLAAAAGCAALTGAGLGYPLVAGQHTVSAAAVGVGALAQLICGAAGIAVGLLCSRLVVRRTGYAVVTGLGLVGVAVVVPGLPPVGPTVSLLSRDLPPERMFGSLAALGAVAIVLLVASAVAAHVAAARQD
ncbi:hypothetical protein WEI85_43545 [Actinomycetes bacterium KLBMP 9797]